MGWEQGPRKRERDYLHLDRNLANQRSKEGGGCVRAKTCECVFSPDTNKAGKKNKTRHFHPVLLIHKIDLQLGRKVKCILLLLLLLVLLLLVVVVVASLDCSRIFFWDQNPTILTNVKQPSTTAAAAITEAQRSSLESQLPQNDRISQENKLKHCCRLFEGKEEEDEEATAMLLGRRGEKKDGREGSLAA